MVSRVHRPFRRPWRYEEDWIHRCVLSCRVTFRFSVGRNEPTLFAVAHRPDVGTALPESESPVQSRAARLRFRLPDQRPMQGLCDGAINVLSVVLQVSKLLIAEAPHVLMGVETYPVDDVRAHSGRNVHVAIVFEREETPVEHSVERRGEH